MPFFHPPPPPKKKKKNKKKKHVKIFANFCAAIPKMFLVEQKSFCSSDKKRFWWKIKNDKNITFWKFRNSKNGSKWAHFGQSCFEVKRPINYIVVWFVIFIFWPLKCFFYIEWDQKKSLQFVWIKTNAFFIDFIIRPFFTTERLYRSPFSIQISPGLS